MSSWYSIPPDILTEYSVYELSMMYRAMVKTKAKERIHRVEENHMDKLKNSKDRDKFLDTIFKQIDEGYKKERTLTEDELKKHLGSIFR